MSWALTASTEPPGRTWTTIRPTSWVPLSRRCTVRSGITTLSSWSWPMPPCPLALRTPITSQEKVLMRSWSPTGTRAPKSFRRTVSPSTQTALPERSSASVKVRPAASVQLPAVK